MQDRRTDKQEGKIGLLSLWTVGWKAGFRNFAGQRAGHWGTIRQLILTFRFLDFYNSSWKEPFSDLALRNKGAINLKLWFSCSIMSSQMFSFASAALRTVFH